MRPAGALIRWVRSTPVAREWSVPLRKHQAPGRGGFVPGVQPLDPTGVGDAFRSGFLTGLAAGLSHRRCAELGSTLAAYVIETVGTQEYVLTQSGLLGRLAMAYGENSAADIGDHVRCPKP